MSDTIVYLVRHEEILNGMTTYETPICGFWEKKEAEEFCNEIPAPGGSGNFIVVTNIHKIKEHAPWLNIFSKKYYALRIYNDENDELTENFQDEYGGNCDRNVEYDFKIQQS